MKFSLDELIAITRIAKEMRGCHERTLELWGQSSYVCRLFTQAARNELTRRSLFEQGRGE